MTNLRKAAQLALDVLETTWGDGGTHALRKWNRAKYALEKALSESPKKEWIGLDEEEFNYYCHWAYPKIINEIEELLEEKNVYK